MIYIIFAYMYTSVSTMLEKGLRKNILKKRRDGEIGKQTKWSGTTEYKIEKVKQTREK